MMLTKSLRNALSATCLKTLGIAASAAILSMQNPVAALSDRQEARVGLATTEIERVLVNSSVQLADNDLWYGSQRDFSIRMPGRVMINRPDNLASESRATQTIYTVVHRTMPRPAFSSQESLEVLELALYGAAADSVSVTRKTYLEISGGHGLEIQVRYPDGSQGQIRAFLVSRRLYIMGAAKRGRGRLPSEAQQFFNSFRIYPANVL